jgi:protein-disulfide isomerase
MSTGDGEQDEQDLTRKQRREQAREERTEAERAVAASAARRTRVMQLGGVGIGVVVIIVIILIATGGGSKSSGILSGTTERSALVNKITALIGNIAQSGNALGKPTAPVTLQYFGDLECPVCQEFSLGALPTLIERFVRPGMMRLEYRSLQSATPETATFNTQQTAALAAGKQNLMWYYIELFYNEQGQEGSGYVTEAYLRTLAQQVPGLNLAAWLAARSDSELTTAITTDTQAANNASLRGTPSFLIGRSGGAMKKLEPASFTDASSFASEIESLVKA